MHLGFFCGWNQNSRVKLLEEVDLRDQNEVVDRRCVSNDSHFGSRLSAEPLSPEVDGAFRDPARSLSS